MKKLYVCLMCHGRELMDVDCPECGEPLHIQGNEGCPAAQVLGEGPFIIPCPSCVVKGWPGSIMHAKPPEDVVIDAEFTVISIDEPAPAVQNMEQKDNDDQGLHKYS